jgi:hypothetical protein
MRTVHARKSTNHHNPVPTRTPAKRADIHKPFTDRIRRLLETRRILTEVLDIQNDLAHGLWDRLFGTVEKLERLRRSFERQAYDEAMHGYPEWVGPDRDATMVRIFDAAGLYFPVAAAAKPIPSTPSTLQLEVVR